MNSNISKDNIEGLKETIRNLYLADDIPWVIGYSGVSLCVMIGTLSFFAVSFIILNEF